MIRFLVLCIIILVVISSIFSTIGTVDAASDNNTNIITVQNGDTLWAIAQNHYSGKDIRRMIYKIEKINNINKCIIYPGQKLTIPLQ